MNEPLIDLDGRVALVTGAGQGIGADAARFIAAHGARVVVNDFVAERAEAVTRRIADDGGAALAAPGDVTSFEQMADIVRRAGEEFGPVDVLVNNAGNAGPDPSKLINTNFWETDPTDWDAFLQVNLHGVMNCCRAVIPGMIEAADGGRIVTVVSDAGRVGEPGLEVYSAAKAGAAGLMRALARSLGRYGITANNVAVATTRTPNFIDAFDDPDFQSKALKKYVIRRFGEPSDAASMVTYLCSSAAGWITGQTYPVNGGYSFAL